MCIFLHREQELSNLMHDKKYIEAIGLAITLDQPYRVLTIMKGKLISFLIVPIDLKFILVFLRFSNLQSIEFDYSV